MTENNVRSGLYRLLLLVAMLPLLASCVTYYYPESATSSGVYYAADDPAVTGYTTVYDDISFYPWWSVDYLYLGYNRGYSSFGIGFGSPWYPYRPWGTRQHRYSSWYYDPWYHDPWYSAFWYSPIYRHHPWRNHVWYQPFWHQRYHHYSGGRHHRGHRDHGRHHGDYANYRDYRGHRDDDRHHGDYANYRGRQADGRRVSGQDPYRRAEGHRRHDDRDRKRGIDRMDPGSGSAVRRVGVAPGSRAGDRGIVIRHRDGSKWSQSRLEPVGAVRSTGQPRAVVREAPVRPDDRRAVTVRRGSSEVRSAADAKRRPTRIQPVTRIEPQRQPRVIEATPAREPRQAYVQRRSDNGKAVIRSQPRGKVSPVQRQPAQPARPLAAPRGNPGRATPPPRPATRAAPPPRPAPAKPAKVSAPKARPSGSTRGKNRRER